MINIEGEEKEISQGFESIFTNLGAAKRKLEKFRLDGIPHYQGRALLKATAEVMGPHHIPAWKCQTFILLLLKEHS